MINIPVNIVYWTPLGVEAIDRLEGVRALMCSKAIHRGSKCLHPICLSASTGWKFRLEILSGLPQINRQLLADYQLTVKPSIWNFQSLKALPLEKLYNSVPSLRSLPVATCHCWDNPIRVVSALISNGCWRLTFRWDDFTESYPVQFHLKLFGKSICSKYLPKISLKTLFNDEPSLKAVIWLNADRLRA